jgi:hypothetical protein
VPDESVIYVAGSSPWQAPLDVAVLDAATGVARPNPGANNGVNTML